MEREREDGRRQRLRVGTEEAPVAVAVTTALAAGTKKSVDFQAVRVLRTLHSIRAILFFFSQL